MIVKALGDSAVVAVLGDRLDEKCLHKVRSLAAALRESRIPGFVEIVPAYTHVTVHYDPIQFCRTGEALPEVFRLIEECEARIRSSKAPAESGHEPAVVEIPVCYGGEYGPDLGYVAGRCSLEDRAVINRHSSVTYAVQAIGFMPGFPYLTGLPQELATPRRSAPRSRVPAGSVAIGGSQTGVYPLATPAGWHIIGRTPQALFDPAKDPPCLLRAGDRVRFRPISIQEYVSWK